jgi:transcription elongation GreA/GreB family factor
MNPKIDKILNYKTISIRQKIDRLLEIDANNYTNLGSDSSKTEKEQVKKESRFIYRAIRTLDKELGNLFLQHQDK